MDPATGHVSYDPAGFAFLKAGDTAIVTIEFDISAGADTFHESLTVTINGVNDAPTVASAVTGGGAEGRVLATVNLLNFASDADAGAVLHVTEPGLDRHRQRVSRRRNPERGRQLAVGRYR